MKSINVVQVAWNWVSESGGAAQSIANFQKALGSYVISFTREHSGNYHNSESVRQLHVPYKQSIINRYSYSVSPLKAKAANVLLSADLLVIHGFYRYHFDWAVRIAKQNGIPYWIIPHGSLDPYVFTYRSISKKLWFRLLGENAFDNASAFVFSTTSEMLKSELKVNPDVSHVIHWPVDSVNTENKEQVKREVRSQLDIPINARVLIYFGRIHPIKRPVETIQAMAACKDSNLYLIVVGPDSDVLSASECERYCSLNNITNVRFVKPIYGLDKFNYFMAADAFISLSFKENFGYTVAESLSVGLPVILSPGIDLGNDLKDIGCSLILSDNNLDSAVTVLKRFCEMPSDILLDMGARGLDWAKAELSRESFNNKIQSLAQKTVRWSDIDN